MNWLAVVVVELVAMAMAFGDLGRAVALGGEGVGLERRRGRRRAASCRPLSAPVFCSSSRQITGCGGVGVELGAVGVLRGRRRCGRTRSRRTACRGRCRRTGSAFRGRSGWPRSCPRCRASRSRRGRGCRRRRSAAARPPSRSISSASIWRMRTFDGRGRCRRGRAIRRSTCRRRGA